MSKQRILQMVLIIGAESPYWQLVFGRDWRARSLAERFLMALLDFALGWNLASSYAIGGLALPVGITETAIVRAHRFLRDPYRRDTHVHLAHLYSQPETKGAGDVLRALLLCQEATFESIANHCTLEVDVVALFEALCWNCRDRLTERLYLARICQQGAFAEAAGNCRGNNCLRVAFSTGTMESVLAAAPPAFSSGKQTPTESHHAIRFGVLSSAAAGLAKGRSSSDENPALLPALKIMVEMRKTRTTGKVSTLGPMSSEAVAMSLNGITEADQTYQLRLERKQRLAAQQATKAESKATPACAD
jgi:hypothetical protein